ncbi:hypothetical protein EIL50_04175 [bacterium NHP-B]|nr:hypothetical protein EIL50_04175 [bacterium NHP-B]
MTHRSLALLNRTFGWASELAALTSVPEARIDALLSQIFGDHDPEDPTLVEQEHYLGAQGQALRDEQDNLSPAVPTEASPATILPTPEVIESPAAPAGTSPATPMVERDDF